jgi:hypothetical protein
MCREYKGYGIIGKVKYTGKACKSCLHYHKNPGYPDSIEECYNNSREEEQDGNDIICRGYNPRKGAWMDRKELLYENFKQHHGATRRVRRNHNQMEDL